MRKLIKFTIKTFIFIISIKLIFTFLTICTEFTYLNVNSKNKEQIIELLKEQESNIFNTNKEIEIDSCYNNLERIEVVFLFPDGENYTLYCNKDKIYFLSDNTNYNLANYMAKNGHKRFRVKKFR